MLLNKYELIAKLNDAYPEDFLVFRKHSFNKKAFTVLDHMTAGAFFLYFASHPWIDEMLFDENYTRAVEVNGLDAAKAQYAIDKQLIIHHAQIEHHDLKKKMAIARIGILSKAKAVING